jgi:hypothetical protein
MNKCPSCVRAGPDIGTCGSHLMCPGTSIPVVPATDIVLHCEPCDKTRVISVVDLVRGRKVALELQCPRGDDCKCRVVSGRPEAEAGGRHMVIDSRDHQAGQKAGPRKAAQKQS